MSRADAMAERAKIVAWLHDSMDNPPRSIPPEIVSATRIIVEAFARAIERGDHYKPGSVGSVK